MRLFSRCSFAAFKKATTGHVGSVSNARCLSSFIKDGSSRQHGITGASAQSQTGIIWPDSLKSPGRLPMYRALHTSDQPLVETIQKEVKITDAGRKVTVNVQGQDISFHSIWLRQNCQCAQCKQAHSGQRLQDPVNLLPKYTATQGNLQGETLFVQCSEEPDHVTQVPLDLLRDHDYSQETRLKQRWDNTPDVCRGGWIPELTYEEVKESKHGLLKWLQNLNNYGLCILKGVPPVEGGVKEAVTLIAPPMTHIYGTYFRVESVPQPINVAYSSAYLSYHMDLVYYESPPGLQFLHCVRFDECVQGGDSIMVDCFAAADDLRTSDPEAFDTLVRVPATFQKIHYDRERPVHMRHRRPHIVTNPEGTIISVHWAPAFEGPLQAAEEDVEPYYAAYRSFAKLLESHDSQSRVRLQPGDLLGFNNHRILHGRDYFELNGGYRLLEGCYMNIDEFKSKLCVVQHQLGIRTPVKRVMNHCSF